jgi:uncharacterized protein (TIGR02145 family)
MKKLLFLLLGILLFSACQKEPFKLPDGAGIAAAKNNNKLDVCHKTVNGSSHVINININAWLEHQAHGDVRLDDQDGDGYVLNNDCGVGPMGDCDDLNATINPGAPEICNNGIDENCNGLIDENCIPSVTICNQTWMLKNLDISTYRNGDVIPEVQDNTTWSNLTTGAWCYVLNNTNYGLVYGKLYNWYAVNDPRGIAPVGWHVPTDVDWTELSDCLGGWEEAGGKMKEAGTTHWAFPNTGATNSSGFTGLPGSYRFIYGAFNTVGIIGAWWSSSEINTTDARYRYLSVFYNSLLSFDVNKGYGLSVRCVKD